MVIVNPKVVRLGMQYGKGYLTLLKKNINVALVMLKSKYGAFSSYFQTQELI